MGVLQLDKFKLNFSRGFDNLTSLKYACIVGSLSSDKGSRHSGVVVKWSYKKKKKTSHFSVHNHVSDRSIADRARETSQQFMVLGSHQKITDRNQK